MRAIKFLETPETIALDYYPNSEGSKWWTVVYDLKIQLSNGDWIVIPAGFKTDLASVPKLLWSFFPPFGKGLLAYLVHDYLYVAGIYSRKFSDDEMLIWAIGLRKNWVDPWLRWIGVRLFGWLVWRNLVKV